MKYLTKIGALGALAMAAAALVVSCGGGGGGGGDAPAATATVIDTASVTKGIAAVSALIPICSSPSAAQLAPIQSNQASSKTVWLAKKFALSQSPQRRILALSSTKPADTLGSCGGRMTYPDYSHANGVTTATFAFDNYCTVDTNTSERLVLNGSIALVDTGTPSASGPIRSKLEASSPAGVTLTIQDATGRPLDAVLISFSNFLYTVGVPGGVPTSASPDRVTLGELRATTQATAQTPSKTYRATGFSAETFTTASGGQQLSASARGYRSNGEYYDVATSVPLVLDATGTPTAGAVTFTGANGSTAVATLVPGSVLQATLTVNGTPLAGMPACN